MKKDISQHMIANGAHGIGRCIDVLHIKRQGPSLHTTSIAQLDSRHGLVQSHISRFGKDSLTFHTNALYALEFLSYQTVGEPGLVGSFDGSDYTVP